MLKITITGDRNEGKTLLAKAVTKALRDLNIKFTVELNLRPDEVINIKDSKQMVTQIVDNEKSQSWLVG